jgi:hypothetical protein
LARLQGKSKAAPETGLRTHFSFCFRCNWPALCIALTTACTSLPLAGEFAIKDSGTQAERGTQIYWISNEEVLFGGPTGEMRRGDGVAEPITRVSVWNVRTNEVKRYGELAGSLCYYEGYVVFWERDVATNRLWINYGKLGETVRQERGPAQGEFDPVTCRPIKELPERPDWTKGLALRWLRPEHGLLVLGSGSGIDSMKNTRLSYCPSVDKMRCVDLPLKRREANGFHWYDFQGAYFVWSEFFFVDPSHPAGGYTRAPWPLDQPRPVWWLYPDGKVEVILLPPSPWRDGGSISFYPTLRGVFVQSHSLSKTGLGNAGGYLVHREKITKLVEAYIENSAVSPDGCRIAYIHDPYDVFPRKVRLQRITLRAIELCRGR